MSGLVASSSVDACRMYDKVSSCGLEKFWAYDLHDCVEAVATHPNLFAIVLLFGRSTSGHFAHRRANRQVLFYWLHLDNDPHRFLFADENAFVLAGEERRAPLPTRWGR